jgi:hypothetical protein
MATLEDLQRRANRFGYNLWKDGNVYLLQAPGREGIMFFALPAIEMIIVDIERKHGIKRGKKNPIKRK